MLNLRLILISTTVLVFIVPVRTRKMYDLIEEIVKNKGTWWLAAAGTTGVAPPWKSCVRTIIKMTERTAECAYIFRNITLYAAPIVSFLGKNARNVTEIRSTGPIHQFMIKTTKNITEGIDKGRLSTPSEFKDEISYDSAVNNVICWEGKKEQPMKWRYIVMPVNMESTINAFFLIGISARIQAPEYQIAIFTKEILDQDEVFKMADSINTKNLVYWYGQELCQTDKENPTDYGYWFPPYCLPKLYLKCAVGYSISDRFNKYNKREDPDDDEVKSIHTGARLEKARSVIDALVDHDATETIWVKHVQGMTNFKV